MKKSTFEMTAEDTESAEDLLVKNMEYAAVIRALRANAREDAATIDQLQRERDELREENKKFREALEWIAERYDDSKPMHQVAMDAYEMSCTAKAVLRKEGTK